MTSDQPPTPAEAAGPAFDAAVERDIFGGRVYQRDGFWRREVDGPHYVGSELIPYFSTSWEAAGLLIEHMRELGYRVQVTNNRDDVPFVAVFSHETRYVTEYGSAVGETGPEALCRAALSAVLAARAEPSS